MSQFSNFISCNYQKTFHAHGFISLLIPEVGHGKHLCFRGIPVLESDAASDEKNRIFEDFLSEGRSAFNKYNVLYLKGISVPKMYEDLLLPEENTNFSCVNWNDTPPATNNFSLESYPLTEIEAKDHAEDMQNSLSNVVLGWIS